MEMDFRNKDIVWTTTPLDLAALNKIPYAHMIGYQQTYSAAAENALAWVERVKQKGAGNVYKKLYTGERRSEYWLPYFGEYHHNISQNWEENQGPLGPVLEEAQRLAINTAKVLKPAAGILFPKNYAGAQEQSYTINVTLLNTNAGTDPASDLPTNAKKNKDWLEDIISGSLHNQDTSLTVQPPWIWEVWIPGVRWSPAAVISNLIVNNVGNLNFTEDFPDGAQYAYPDAWNVSITIRELINESRAIYRDAVTPGFPGETRTF